MLFRSTIGRIEQVGTPQELYNEPANKFVAGFIGSPAMNFFEVTVAGNKLTDGDQLNLTLTGGQEKLLTEKGYQGKKVILGIRPEDISADLIVEDTFPGDVVEAEVVVSELLGSDSVLYCKVGSQEFSAKVDASNYLEPGSKLRFTFKLPKSHLFDLDYQSIILLSEIFEKLKAGGYTIIVIEHRLFYMKNLCDRLIVMGNGKISGIYEKSELKTMSNDMLHEKGLRGINLIEDRKSVV